MLVLSVKYQVLWCLEQLDTEFTSIWPIICVQGNVLLKLCEAVENHGANVATEDFLDNIVNYSFTLRIVFVGRKCQSTNILHR